MAELITINKEGHARRRQSKMGDQRANYPTKVLPRIVKREIRFKSSLGHLLTIVNPEHRHSKPVQGFRQPKGPFTCHESHFSDLPPYECPMTPNNSEIPTYTHNSGGSFSLEPAEPCRICNDAKRSIPLHVLIGGVKKTIMSIQSVRCLRQQGIPAIGARITRCCSGFAFCFWQLNTLQLFTQQRFGSSIA